MFESVNLRYLIHWDFDWFFFSFQVTIFNRTNAINVPVIGRVNIIQLSRNYCSNWWFTKAMLEAIIKIWNNVPWWDHQCFIHMPPLCDDGHYDDPLMALFIQCLISLYVYRYIEILTLISNDTSKAPNYINKIRENTILNKRGRV